MRKWKTKLAIGIAGVSLAILLVPLGLAECFYLVGRIQSRRLNPPRAVQAYSTAIQIRPRAGMYLARADCLHTLGRLGEAIQDFDEALRRGASRLAVLEGRGNAKLLSGDVNGAIDDWSAAIELAPQRWENFYGRGIARFRVGDVQSALDDFTRSLSLSSQPFHLIFVERGRARLSLRDYDGAIEDATACLKLNANVNDAYVVRGRASEARGDIDAALRDYTSAINLATLNVEPYLDRCDAYLRKGENGSAREDAETVVRRNPQQPDGYYARGRVRAADGDPQGAASDLHKALSLAPNGWAHKESVERLLKQLQP